MTKTTIKETTEKFDKDGKLVERIVREETTEDDTDYIPYNPYPYGGTVCLTCKSDCPTERSE